jgi:biopolymer transport protein ExbB/TolQ
MAKAAETAGQSNRQFARQTGTAGPAFMIGLPIAALILWAFHAGPFKDLSIARYLKHEVECVEVILFCCAFAALSTKLWRSVGEKAAILAGERGTIIPTWDGQTVPVDDAPTLLGALSKLPRRLKRTYLAGRVADVLDFLRSRRSATELDDQLRSLADADAMALEGSYALTRFITWAIPILGFLGTVLGITGAITGITPEKLEKDLSAVTDGLALAFDATALGLGLTMVTMFLSFLVERAEQSVLEAVDRFIDHELAHRFERDGADTGEFAEVVRRQAQALIKMSEHLVTRQAELWAKSFEQVEKRAIDMDQRQQQRLVAALTSAMDQTQDAHAQRVAALEKQGAERTASLVGHLTNLASAVRDAGKEQQAAFAPLARGLADQVQAMSRFQQGEKQMLELQDALNKNLAALVAALGGFEFRVSAPEFRVRLEPNETKPELKLHKPGKAA